MGQITDALFGGASRNAARQQVAGLERAQESVERARQEAQQAIEPRFQGASNIRRTGYQGVFDVLGGAAPAQAQIAQQGNIEAQKQLLRGGRQANTAILGGPIDYSELYSRPLQFDFGAYQTPNIAELLGQTQGYRGYGQFTQGAPIQVGFETTPGDVNPNNPTNNQGEQDMWTPDVPGNGEDWPEDQPPPNRTPDAYPPPQDVGVPQPGVTPVEQQGGGRQAPITEDKNMYSTPSQKDVSLYGGQYSIRKGETLADVQRRLESQGHHINPQAFYNMFGDYGAWG